MYIKNLNIYGFKSFAERTHLDFDRGITAIVGPNGSGKSNVADAIRWVLGEQSARTLRGGKMEDIIFSGTQLRKPLGLAEVSLTIDNTNGVLPLEYSEITITRRAFRSSENEYYINRSLCRLKDIVELFMDTGLGKEGYSIIGQGKIDEILSIHSTDRRRVFEQAAGIGKYKARKEEAEIKLDKTRENLVRIEDIVNEIEQQLIPLKSQSAAAQRFNELRQQLKRVEINKFLHQYKKHHDKIGHIKRQRDLLESDIEKHKVELENDENANKEEVQSFNRRVKTIEVFRDQKQQLLHNLEKTRGETGVFYEKLRQLIDENKRLEEEVKEDEIFASDKEAQNIVMLSNKIEIQKASHQQIQLIRAEVADMNNKIQTLKSQKQYEETCLQSHDSELSRLETVINGEKQQFEAKNARLELLENMRANHEGYNFGVKNILKSYQQGKIPSSKMCGVIADLVEVQKEYRVAIETSLGNGLQFVVTECEEDAKYIIEFLKSNGYGRATFLPISSAKPRILSRMELTVMTLSGCRGIASSLIKFDSKYQGIFESLLGRTVVTETLDQAIHMAKKFSYSFRIVTLQGEMMNPGGSITGGEISQRSITMLAGKDEIAEIKDELHRIQGAIKDKQNRIQEVAALCRDKSAIILAHVENIHWLEIKIAAQMQRLEAVNSEYSKLSADIKALEEFELQESDDERRVDSTEREVRLVFEQAKHLTLDLQRYKKSIYKKKARIQENLQCAREYQSVIELKQQIIQESIYETTALDNEILRNEDIKTNLGSSIEYTANHMAESRQHIERLTEMRHRLELQVSKLEAEVENLHRNIWEVYEVSYGKALEFWNESLTFTQIDCEIYSIKEEMQALGEINMNSVEDFRKLKLRCDSLKAQKQDLIEAQQNLNKVIDDITHTMKRIFCSEFDTINLHFNRIFCELFGGGSAQLVMEDKSQPLDCGIDIIAQPPGKKLQSISLLSGGEKALTAITILFAILKRKPALFCLLDEVEAVLDESNLYNLAVFLKKFSMETQFVVITHRKITMEMCDTLYGVVMEEKGISKIASVKFKDKVG